MQRISIAVLAVLLTGCFGPSEEEQRAAQAQAKKQQAREEAAKTEGMVQEAVRSRLKDPTSAQFGLITFITPDHACQTVNARNGFGGYSGDRQAFVLKAAGAWHAVKIESISHLECVSIMNQISQNASKKP